MSLGSFFDSAPSEDRKISPGSKKRADAPTQQMENFVDIVDLKQLMERVLDHSVPPICAIIRRKRLCARATGKPIHALEYLEFKLGHYPPSDDGPAASARPLH